MPENILTFKWQPVTTSGNEEYLYPMVSSQVPRSYSRPLIYRWVLSKQGTPSQYFIGETTDLCERVEDYRSARIPYHERVREIFEKHRSVGGQIQLETLDFIPIVINGVEFSPAKLEDPFIRSILENLCCVILEQQEFQVVNRQFAKQKKRTPRSEHSKRYQQRQRELIKLGRQVLAANEQARENTSAEIAEEKLRQGTASAVPTKAREEGGFSR
ncbi:MAG: hypothetical protein HY649_07490 [Acidobacteria bacterium]|nr:hypothetical protein [Acidobacteriota bacterium]